MAATNQRTRMYRDILITAIEGGINYWASVLHYDPDIDYATHDSGDGIHAVIVEDADGAKSQTIDTKAIRSAMSKLHKGEGYSLRSHVETPEWWKKKWRKAYRECADGSWDFDAADADQIVQVAVFGEVVYG